ncbi:MAG: sugar phosphate nucleotidyltransferase [Bacteroidota bacterium]
MKPSLLILAAGMGSRYGGLKQIDGVGPSNETILEYSIYDAIEAGFGKVVFVIRESIEEDFKAHFGDRFKDLIEVAYVFQELDNVPEGVTVNPERVKPLGTGHAVLVAAEAINEPFAVINADDFYGRAAFQVMHDHLVSLENTDTEYAMVGYRVSNTLSENGHVSRGVCVTDADSYLETVTERTKIARGEDETIYFEDESGESVSLPDDTLVSMNFWGFTPHYFTQTGAYFEAFIKENFDQLKAEFYIPTAVSNIIDNGQGKVKVLSSDASWFGVTYKEDKDQVMGALAGLAEEAVYPSPLW